MTKQQQIDEIQKKYQMICQTKDANKKSAKHLPGHGFYKKADGTWLTAGRFLVCYAASSAAMLFGFGMNLNMIALPALAFGAVLGVAVPFGAKKLMAKSKGKYGLAAQKMELDKYFEVFEKSFRTQYQDILNTKDASNISQDRIHQFVKDLFILAQNYDTSVQDVVKKRIEKQDKKDYKKVERLANIINQNNNNKILEKIKKIVAKNQKITDSWRDFYNKREIVAKNLYKAVIDIDPQNNQNLECIEEAKQNYSSRSFKYDVFNFAQNVKKILSKTHLAFQKAQTFDDLNDISESEKSETMKQRQAVQRAKINQAENIENELGF